MAVSFGAFPRERFSPPDPFAVAVPRPLNQVCGERRPHSFIELAFGVGRSLQACGSLDAFSIRTAEAVLEIRYMRSLEYDAILIFKNCNAPFQSICIEALKFQIQTPGNFADEPHIDA
jgi:hypothetical protein